MKDWLKSLLLAFGAFVFWSVAPIFVLLFITIKQYQNDHPGEEFSLSFSLNGISFNDAETISILDTPNVEWAFIICAILTIGSILLIAKKVLIKNYLQVNFQIPARTVLKWLGITLVAVVAIDITSSLLQLEPKSLLDVADLSGVEFLIVGLLVVLLIPFLEELIFRGLMQRAISDRFGYFFGIVSTSFLFTMIHFQYEFIDLALMFPVSLIFCLAKYDTKSTMVAFFCHLLANSYFLFKFF